MSRDIIPTISTGPFEATPTGLVVANGEIPIDLWRAYGAGLKRVEGAIQWVIGDWLNFGEAKYGETYAQALELWPEAEYKTLANQKSVSKRVELSLRRESLSWFHHEAIAKLEPADQKKWLAQAEKNDWSVRELRAAIKDSRRLPTPDLPEGKYSVIYADPPWPVGSMVLDKWESPIDDKYPTMTLEEIAALGVADLAADDCSLFLWTTHTFLPAALSIMDGWGFSYFCCMTWDKGGGWTQNGFHKRTEFLLFGYKGTINVDQHGDAIPTIFVEKKGEHSAKPGSIRDMIARKTPGPRLEMFARGSYPGWKVWGNEV